MLMTRDDPGDRGPSDVKSSEGSVVGASRISHRVVASICILGLIITALSTWAAWRVDRNAEARLLQVQTRQAAAVLSTAVLIIQQPLDQCRQCAVSRRWHGRSGDLRAFHVDECRGGPDLRLGLTVVARSRSRRAVSSHGRHARDGGRRGSDAEFPRPRALDAQRGRACCRSWRADSHCVGAG